MTEPSQEQQFDEVYDGPDPDLESIERMAAEDDDIDVETDELRPEEEELEFEPPEEPSTPTSHGYSSLDEQYGDTIDDRLAQEEPDI